ncbi:MAG: hypothetical protein HYZ37_07040 [Candidatus Solibacter usitatus]|nr:hypothetical protein [Candidatus Solibacter usitatus]
MKRFSLIAVILLVAAAAVVTLYPQRQAGNVAPPAPANGPSFRVLLGVGDREATKWDGSVASTGRVATIRGWRFADGDRIQGNNWQASTRVSLGRKKKVEGIFPNGVVISLAADDPGAKFEVKTAQGNFSFTAKEIGFGVEKPFLNGKAAVDRVPTTTRLTQSGDEQDFPSIANSADAVYVSYVEFLQGDRSNDGRQQLDAPPANFDSLARPAGGDQVMLLRYSKQQSTWSAPIPVSAAKQDVMRTAVAVDGKKRAWVFWSANQNGNFDIYAKPYADGKWGNEVRITNNAGTDVNPVAAVDSQGRVWVAWQGFRGNSLDILVAAQNGDTFTAESVVSASRSESDWDPSIAAASNGEVAVAWDTYDKGNYDVYFRRMKWDGSVKMEAPVAAAASPNFEARASVAYDGQNRLWVAYEASGAKWGKDFGAYETTGVALYQDHDIRVKCFQGSQAMVTSAELKDALPGAAAIRRARRAAQESPVRLPDASLASKRPASGTPQPGPTPLNSFPRIAADGNGGIYLAFRSPSAGFTALGSGWTQQLVFLDGNEWKGPVPVPNSDYWMDMRAAMASTGPGQLMMVAASDHRQTAGVADPANAATKGKKKGKAGDGLALAALQSDLFASVLSIGGETRTAALKAAPAERTGSVDPEVSAERAQVALMRNYRAQVGSEKLQMMRGEFHRHTEVSGDGGRDGPLIDAYRYMIDAAYMDWGGCCDHNNGNGREYSWWIQQKLTDAYKLGTRYVPMFSYERSIVYPEGHRNTVMARRGVRPLPRLALSPETPSQPAPDTQMLYRYLKHFGGIVASHTSGTNMGTDWRDNDPLVEPVVEIYQGDRQNYEMPGAPRSNNADDSIGGWRPLGFVSLALEKGYRLAFQASSDHISTHMSYCNLWVAAPTREAIMESFRKRRVYGATENILADVRCSGHFMGEEFSLSEPPSISVKLWGTANFAKVHIVKDGKYAYSVSPNTKTVDFAWRDANATKGKTSYYYVRGEQADGELVWVSPMWITYK